MGEAARQPGGWPASLAGRADVERVLAEVSAGGSRRRATAGMAQPVHRAGEAAARDWAASGTLPVVEEIGRLLPWPGLRMGATVNTTGSTSLLQALIGGAMTGTDVWSAVVGVPQFGTVSAATGFGVPLERLALVPYPGPDWPTVVGALIDGLGLVAVAPPPGTMSDATARSLMGRARTRGCVLLVISKQPWAGTDLTVTVTGRRWRGLGDGHGRLRHCELDVEVRGRGSAAQPRRATLRLPSPAPSFPGGPADRTPQDVGGQAQPPTPDTVTDVRPARERVAPREVTSNDVVRLPAEPRRRAG